MSEQKVLAFIEGIVGDDACEVWSMLAATKKLRGRAKEMEYKLGQIYRIAHAFNESNSCYSVHEDWRKVLEAES